jgi:hypothetical protein
MANLPAGPMQSTYRPGAFFSYFGMPSGVPCPLPLLCRLAGSAPCLVALLGQDLGEAAQGRRGTRWPLARAAAAHRRPKSSAS